MSTASPSIPDPAGAAPTGVFATLPGSPLDELQFLMLRQAAIRRRPICRAARLAYKSAWTILIVGFLGWPTLLYMPSLSGLAVVAGICGIGALEYIGAGKMHDGLRAAPKFLARNQLAFIILIAVYCVYQMLTFNSTELFSSPEVKQQITQLSGLMGDMSKTIEALVPVLVYAFWCIVLFTFTIVQGGLALYYITRGKHIELYERETPAWIKRIMTEVES